MRDADVDNAHPPRVTTKRTSSLCLVRLTVRYLSGVFRISKGEGEFLLVTSAHTKGAKPSFPIFSYGEKKLFAEEGPWPNGPPKYANMSGYFP